MDFINSLIKYLDPRRRPKSPYEELVKAEKTKRVRVRKGHVPLHVGKEKKRYEVPVKYLSLPSFQELIVYSQPIELDIQIDGPIVLACSTEVFDELLSMAKVSYRSRAR